MGDLDKIATEGIDYQYTLDVKTGIYFAIGLAVLVFVVALFYNYLNKQ